MPEVVFFPTPEDLRAWFRQHHTTARELHAGFYKKDSGKPSIMWPESVDEALCVGWIDGVRRSLGPESYTIRFTPRKPGSIWSAVNLKRIEVLTQEGRMQPTGLAAFEQCRETRSVVYAYEQKENAELPEEFAAKFRSNPAAWEWFQKQAPWYRHQAAWRVISAKQETTRQNRLAKLIEASAKGERW